MYFATGIFFSLPGVWTNGSRDVTNEGILASVGIACLWSVVYSSSQHSRLVAPKSVGFALVRHAKQVGSEGKTAFICVLQTPIVVVQFPTPRIYIG